MECCEVWCPANGLGPQCRPCSEARSSRVSRPWTVEIRCVCYSTVMRGSTTMRGG
ncbi:hypothetical protein BD626DRAFT_507739 [Schizophyllum amplum]|uniref:Uncharacterized protein n=1 Tax=Schizophyllum amplum TaxID=97359 RepID=A0A550C471_9AGAR|nr:hypothetical protein BD626DRAFT_507739 [Auriculariopsis ampla]